MHGVDRKQGAIETCNELRRALACAIYCEHAIRIVQLVDAALEVSDVDVHRRRAYDLARFAQDALFRHAGSPSLFGPASLSRPKRLMSSAVICINPIASIDDSPWMIQFSPKVPSS